MQLEYPSQYSETLRNGGPGSIPDSGKLYTIIYEVLCSRDTCLS
jgi:hypothetical protein